MGKELSRDRKGKLMKIVVFGANGATGRLLTAQALAASHEVVAVTRRPGVFPKGHSRLSVVGADVHDTPAVDQAIQGADVVLSTLGVPFTHKPVNTTGTAGSWSTVSCSR